MTNKENQARLDRKKWEESLVELKDMSGQMYYCKHCKHREGNTCAISHEQRVATSACAKADNTLKRKK